MVYYLTTFVGNSLHLPSPPPSSPPFPPPLPPPFPPLFPHLLASPLPSPLVTSPPSSPLLPLPLPLGLSPSLTSCPLPSPLTSCPAPLPSLLLPFIAYSTHLSRVLFFGFANYSKCLPLTDPFIPLLILLLGVRMTEINPLDAVQFATHSVIHAQCMCVHVCVNVLYYYVRTYYCVWCILPCTCMCVLCTVCTWYYCVCVNVCGYMYGVCVTVYVCN